MNALKRLANDARVGMARTVKVDLLSSALPVF
jgi:hypothetical protein